MVQESTNTFSDGLIKDLNPLTTPNTVLTDAKNATLLTFNGNELVLQNDFGNSKIENVNLKEGYNPIGVKEHGGILYIVSKHPDGNIEIGSFPSPEVSEEIKTPILTDLTISEIGENLNKNFILSDNKIYPGDKFLIALNINAENLISQNYGSERNYYKLKLLLINEGSEIDLTSYLNNQQKKNESIYENTNFWFVPLYENETINIEDYREYLQIHKYKKSGYLAIRVELETIDEFKIKNIDETEYPIFQRTETTGNLIFNIFSEFGSKIKPNHITLDCNIYDKNNLETFDSINMDNVFDSTNITSKEVELTVNIGENSINKIVDYTLTIESNFDEFDIQFDKFKIRKIIDLSKDPLTWETFGFWKIEKNTYKTNGTFKWYYIIAYYGYVKGILTPLNANNLPIESHIGDHLAYRLSDIETDDEYQNYDIIGTFEIDTTFGSPTYNKAINFTPNSSIIINENIRSEIELIPGYLYKGHVLSHQVITSTNWRIPTNGDIINFMINSASSYKIIKGDSYNNLYWGEDEVDNSNLFSALSTGVIISSPNPSETKYLSNKVIYWGAEAPDDKREFFGFTEGEVIIDNQATSINNGGCIRLVCDQNITDEDFEPPIDYYGRVYRYQRIGNLTWMIEDLKTDKAVDGTQFNQITGITSNEWETGLLNYIDIDNLIE